MSALTDLFTALANKIRSKTGTQTTYTPSEMVSDGIDDVYDAGVASATTPITPSNSSPASMTANTGYKPTANGYAIASYDSVTPSSTPESVASGDIVKIGGSGVIVDAIPTPTSITPSNSSPVALTANTAVEPTTSGYAIASYRSIPPDSIPTSISLNDVVKVGGSGYIVDNVSYISPSNSSPATITSGNIYKATSSGYAISSYSSITPSNSSPVSLSSGGIYKMGGAGKAVASVTNATPSDSSPPSITSGSIIKALAAGYLVSSVGASSYVTKIVINMTLKVKVTTINGNTGTEISGSANTKTFSNNKITINIDNATPSITKSFSKASGISDYFLSAVGYSPGKGKAQVTSWTIASVTITMNDGTEYTF